MNGEDPDPWCTSPDEDDVTLVKDGYVTVVQADVQEDNDAV